jgi:hypothetical protein
MTRGNERRILNQCAPALTGVKTGSLLKVEKMVCNEALDLLASFENQDVGTKVLCTRGSFSLILVYRRDMLAKVLGDHDTHKFLSGMGYTGSMSDYLARLSERMHNNIQHELGIFLGYPLCDVKGFMEKHGRGYLSSGCWRVYGDVAKAMRLFARIKESRHRCLKLFDSGLSLQSAIAAF